MTDLRVVSAQAAGLDLYLDLLEEVTEWLDSRGIKQWNPGTFRRAEAYFAESIRRGEVYLGFLDNQVIGTLRLLLEDPIVWPEIKENDAIYVYNLAVRRAWAGEGLGARLLQWGESHARSLGRDYIRLDCFANNDFLCSYYQEAAFVDRGEIDAQYPEPVGTLRLRRFEKRVSVD